ISCLMVAAARVTTRDEARSVVIARNYGGRDEVARASQKLSQRAMRGEIGPEDINVDVLASSLDTAGIPDPELVIRTSGELRLSNFLLWQAAYSELVFQPCYWPDFGPEQLAEALHIFNQRERRFGGLAAQDVAL